MSKTELYEIFKNPGAEWRGKPFWSWNGELREDEIRRQIHVMKEMGLGGYFMHSRAGLITEYLGDEWFDLINAGADEGEKTGMEAWLYDEDRWPSGSAGGKVTVDPQYRMKSLVLTEQPRDAFVRDDGMCLVFAARIDGVNVWGYRPITVTDDAQAVCDALDAETAGRPGEIKVLSFTVVPDRPNSNYNGTTYIDTMSRAAVDRFIALTHEQYKERCGERLGTSIKGIFTDEPHRGKAMDDMRISDGRLTCSMCYTDDFFAEFEARCGYRAEDVLPELFYRPMGERLAPVKRDWFNTADNLFLERFARPINDWCEQHGIVFTGHVLHEDSLTNQSVPHGSLMRFYEYMGAPGVDVLSEYNRCYWIVKQLSSAARQLGKKWLLSELYGCTGWQFNFKSHKAVGDWQALFGINLRCQHLSWYTMEGESKRDYPASILHQSPWYPYYNEVETYFARFGAFMTEGTPVCDVLVLNPIESVWAQAYRGWANWISPDASATHIHILESNYTALFHILTSNHIDFDYGEEQMMEAHASVDRDPDGKPVLRVGNMTYRSVIVSGMETIRPTTLQLLADFAAVGVKIIFAGDIPDYVNAVRDTAPMQFAAEHGICTAVEEDELIGALREITACPISVTKADGTAAHDVFVQMRSFGDSLGFVLLNINRDNPTEALTVTVQNKKYQNAEFWDLRTGERFRADVMTDGESVILKTSLPAAGTAAFVLTAESDAALPPMPAPMTAGERFVIDGTFDYETSEPNVCVLDFARFSFDGGDWSEEAEILRVDGMVRDTVGIERRGGEMLQPWYAKLHDTRVYGRVRLEYTFNIETLPAGDLILAGERPERMHYAINGVALENDDTHNFWIDDCFKKMVIPRSALKIGINAVTAEVDFMRTTNLEALYLIGDFGVSLDGHRRTLTNRAEHLPAGDLANAAMPFYTGEVTYLLTPDKYAALTVCDGERVLLSPTSFTGSLLRVQPDGGPEIRMIWDPYEADVTDAVRAKKTIRVTVVGTRRNLFGPLHFAPIYDGAYGPGHFVTGGDAWTDDYALIPSGIESMILQKYKA